MIVQCSINCKQIPKPSRYIACTGRKQNGPFLVIYAPKKIDRIDFAWPGHHHPYISTPIELSPLKAH